MEQGLYTQFVKLCWKDLKFIATNKSKNEAKYKFQGHSAISQCWFHLYFDCIEVNLRTHSPNFYKELFQIHDNTQDDAPMLNYS